MNPSFFGPPGEQLLGVHHPPRAGARGLGVVLCPAAPLEAVRSHWAFRKLAEQLAKAGFDVLRFDYRGTGDSNGELGDTTPEQWVEDVKRAVRELKDISGVRGVAVVGFRFGALIAAMAAGQGLGLERLVLWEPVVSVRHWLGELDLIERQLYREFHDPPPRDGSSVLGFVLPPSLRSQWDALDLRKLPRWKPATAIVAATISPELQRLQQAWATSEQDARWHLVPSASGAGATGALLGNEAIEEIIKLLGERR